MVLMGRKILENKLNELILTFMTFDGVLVSNYGKLYFKNDAQFNKQKY
jgi:hypothetical protein